MKVLLPYCTLCNLPLTSRSCTLVLRCCAVHLEGNCGTLKFSPTYVSSPFDLGSSTRLWVMLAAAAATFSTIMTTTLTERRRTSLEYLGSYSISPRYICITTEIVFEWRYLFYFGLFARLFLSSLLRSLAVLLIVCNLVQMNVCAHVIKRRMDVSDKGCCGCFTSLVQNSQFTC
jgi:hypothetical protein